MKKVIKVTTSITLLFLMLFFSACTETSNVEFDIDEGSIVETPEARLDRLKEEITEVGLEIEDVTSDYDLSGTPITKVEITDNAQIIYTVEVDGYNPGIKYLVAFDLTTNDIIGFRVIEQNEISGFGSIIEDPTFQEQFNDLAQDAIDDIGGTTALVTLGALKRSLEEVVDFHKAEFQGS
jgi:Na+-translocating ferredoxin:NAD+ oxidoreductase RnfG subunit